MSVEASTGFFPIFIFFPTAIFLKLPFPPSLHQTSKSTILKALQNSIYNHIPGDGREFVVTDSTAITIEAEDGRFVHSVNISPFIDNLPISASSDNFSTLNASGSTSQAASIVEAIECQTKVLLIDEDKTATNFMCRDKAMQMLVAPEKEPITPFISKVNSIYKQFGISTLLVVGGLGEYFTVADYVLMMDCFQIKLLFLFFSIC